jgi:predicted GNAT family acetyltransferase
MEVQFERQGSKGSFFVEEDGDRLATMTFSMAGDTLMIIDHTEVSDVLRGKSVGKQLVSTAVEYARKNSVNIIPLCPFAKSVFEKVPAFQDVLKS